MKKVLFVVIALVAICASVALTVCLLPERDYALDANVEALSDGENQNYSECYNVFNTEGGSYFLACGLCTYLAGTPINVGGKCYW